MNTYALLKCPTDDNMMRRYCNSNLEWGPVDYSHCLQIYCPATEGWPRTFAGNSASIPCGENQIGLQTRLCEPTGAWAAPDVSLCSVPSCPADDAWPQAEAGQTLSIECPATYSGSIFRTCTVDGWLSPVEQCEPLYCPATETYPQTRAGASYSFACGEDYEGEKVVACNADGTWGAEDASACQFIYRCPADDAWERTLGGTTASLPCGGAYDGTQTRACSETGVWDDVDRSACQRVFCAALDSTWVETDRDTTIYTACPEGQLGVVYRECGHDGTWGPINSHNCKSVFCHGDAVWPDTEPNTNALLPCSVGLSGSVLRFCDEQGEWQDPDYSQCAPLLCPEEELDGATWPETAYNTASVRLPCPYGYNNYMYRDCGLDGAWGPVDTSACSLKYCPEEGAFPSTPSFSYANVTCPEGYSGVLSRYCDNGSWWAIEGECVQIVCPADGDWPETVAGESVSRDCAEGYSGSVSRTCGADGVWGEVQDQCQRLMCAQEASGGVTWPETASGETATVDCENGEGIRYRTCSLQGVWVGDGLTCWANKCPQEGIWPLTYPARRANVTCGPEYEGNQYRACLPLGYWSDEIDRSECVLRQCVGDGLWPSTDIGQTASVACTGGSQGSMTRVCNADAQWEQPDKSGCTDPQCDAEDAWPATDKDTTAYAPCEPGHVGYVTRYCDGLGQWQAPDASKCFRTYCAASDPFPTTASGESASAPCPAGFSGTQTRACSIDAQWQAPDLTQCQPIVCPEDGVWPQTQYNTTVSRDCPPMTVGAITRRCGPDGAWEPVVDACSPLYCPQDTTLWGATLAGQVAVAPCPAGYTGSMTRTCSVAGAWEPVNLENCHNENCPVSGEWPETQVGVTLVHPCPEGFVGNQTRTCTATDHWGDVDTSACKLYPTISFAEPVLLDYSAQLSFTVNTPLKLYYNLTTADITSTKEGLLTYEPTHIVDVDVPGVLAFGDLQESTQYRLNVFIVSDEGVESPLRVVDLSVVFTTIPVILPAIEVLADSIEPNVTSVQFSARFTQKFGTIWCNVVSGEPTVQAITEGPSAVLAATGDLARLTIDGLLVETEYDAYCYAEDYRSVPMDLAGIPATKFHFKTGYNANELVVESLQTAYNTESYRFRYSHRGSVCCAVQPAASAAPIASQAECTTEVVEVSAETDYTAEVADLEDNTAYVAHCLAVYYYDENVTAVASFEFSTPMKFPAVSIGAVVASYDYIATHVTIDRPGSVWCYASLETYVSDLDVIKKAPQYAAQADTEVVYITEPVESEKEYYIVCYAENTFGTATSEMQTATVTTLSVPPTVSIYQALPSTTTATLTVKCTSPATVYCLATPASDPVPELSAFDGLPGTECSAISSVVLGSLVSNTAYNAYCVGYSDDGRINRNSIESTKTGFQTLIIDTTISGVVATPSSTQNEASVEVTCSNCHRVACLALSASAPAPLPNSIYHNGQSQFFEGNESGTKTFLFADLQLHHAYRVYCHATGLAGNPMSTAQEDATAEFMSPAVPSIELAPLASEPYALSISVTSTYFSRVRCLAKVATGDNSVPPTKETIISDTDQDYVVPEYGSTTIRIAGRMPNTNYDVYCVAFVYLDDDESYDFYSETKSVAVSTTVDSSRPIPFLSCDNCDVDPLNTLPVIVTLSFNRPLQSTTFVSDNFHLENVQFDHVETTANGFGSSNPTFKLYLYASSSGVFSIYLKENVVRDLADNQNTQSSTLSKIYAAGRLTTLLDREAITATSLTVKVMFTKPTTVYCQVADSVPSIEDLRQSAFKVIVQSNAYNDIVLSGLNATTQYSVYCYAEERYQIDMDYYYVPMENTIASTKIVATTTDGNCPKVNGLICNGLGTCTNGETCQCNDLAHGAACELRCPGYFVLDDGALDCSGHGTCSENADRSPFCTCSNTELYGGDDCSLLQLVLSKPTEGNAMIFMTQTLEAGSDFEFETQGFNKKQQNDNFRLAQADVLGNTVANSRIDNWDLMRQEAVNSPAFYESSNKLSLVVVSHVMVPEDQVEEVQEKNNSTDAWLTALQERGMNISSIHTTKVFTFPSSATDPFYCYDKEHSNDETDVDCGGPTCVARCGLNKKCSTSSDCQDSLYCDKFERICMEKHLSTLAMVAIYGTIVLVILLILIMILVYCLYVKKPKEGKYYFEEEELEFGKELKAKREAEAAAKAAQKTKEEESDALLPNHNQYVDDLAAVPILSKNEDVKDEIEIHVDEEDEAHAATDVATQENTNEQSTQNKSD